MRRFLILLAPALALAALAADAVAAPARPAAAPATTTQLPRGVVPRHYEVALVPDAAAMRFEGRVVVTIDVERTTSRITLHAAGLEFVSARLGPATAAAAEGVAATRIDLDAPAQTATFTFERPVRAGRHRLALVYRGVIGTQAEGLFAIDYGTGGQPRRALFTQFEHSHARHVVPSWDEPAYKATFALEVTVPAALMAVSNMPASAVEELAGERRKVRFATTPRMSSYLLFFALGDFERVTAQEGATEIGIVSRRGTAAQAAVALGDAVRILREYNDYFGVAYPLPKLDNVASPGASQYFGAMENWGAILTFERFLLLDPALSSEVDRRIVFGFAAHEIGHQWFGNLVTMRWWDDLWLNEGFASWLQDRTVQRLHPEWNSALRVAQRRDEAMEVDAFATSHAIVQRVETTEQVSQAFDTITYSKGAAVIAMLEAYVGEVAWRDGVRRYVRENAYGNAVTDDLWRAIERGAGSPIVAIAHDFTRQPGVPLLRVEAASCRGGRTTLRLVQAEFSADRPERSPRRWRLPVIARVDGHAPARTLVVGGRGTLVLDGCGAVVANAGRSGYYRTWQAPAQRGPVRDAFARLDTVDQLGLLDDAWALGLAGSAPLGEALELVERVPIEGDAALWGRIAARLEAIDDFYRGEAVRQARWRAYAVARLAPILARIGWQGTAGESPTVSLLRGQLIGILGGLGDAATIAEARRRHAARATDPGAYPATLRKSILGVVALHADAATWDALHAEAKAAASPVARERLYELLAAARDPALAHRALELSISGESGATTAASMVSAVAGEHPDLAFDFAVAHRAQLDGLIGTNGRRFYPRLAKSSVDPAMAAKLTRFADESGIEASARREVESAIARVRYRSIVAGERLVGIDEWLKSRDR